jgi:hypothetical protein
MVLVEGSKRLLRLLTVRRTHSSFEQENKMRTSLLHAALLFAVPAVAASIADAAEPFDTAEIYVEKNATDDDTEIVIEAVGGDDGLCHFRVVAPGGREIFHFDSDDRSTGGLREFLVESPEPPGDAILAAYPEGLYRFRGRTCDGQAFASADWLSHRLPAATVITSPPVDGEVDGSNGLVIEWSAVPGVAEYILELENESVDPEQSLTLNLPADTTRFRVPAHWIASGAEYQVGVGTVARNGNVVFAEIEFTTAD